MRRKQARQVHRGMAVLVFAAALLALSWALAAAQKQDSRWAGPFRLSTQEGDVQGDGAVLQSDPFGNVHAFWVETGQTPDDNFLLMYARFDGENWSAPVDIFVGPPAIPFDGFLGPPVIDPRGRLHLVFTVSKTGPIVYLTAPATDALSARRWTRAAQFQASALKARMAADSAGILHLAYADFFGSDPGIYYVQSADGGASWSSPAWLDSDIPAGYGPRHVILEVDPSDDSLHLFWKYEEVIDGSFFGKELRYARSQSSGKEWSLPFLVDLADEDPNELRAGGMLLSARSGQVHVIWAGDQQTHREHRFSTDGGRTWGPSLRIFGSLNGSAGDSMAVDGNDRAHFLGQIRYPQGLYEIVWQGNQWGVPSLVYLISRDPFDPLDGRIHIHAVESVFRLGNQLVTLFTNSPTDPVRILYAMHRTLEDVPAADPMPTPTPTPEAASQQTASPQERPPTPTATQLPFDPQAPQIEPAQANGFMIGALAAIVLLSSVVLFIAIRRR